MANHNRVLLRLGHLTVEGEKTSLHVSLALAARSLEIQTASAPCLTRMTDFRPQFGNCHAFPDGPIHLHKAMIRSVWGRSREDVCRFNRPRKWA